MKPTSCFKHQFDMACINNTEMGLWIEDRRIERDSIPEGFHLYEVRHSDDDFCTPCTLENHVLVNFLGSFITDHEIDLGSEGYINIDTLDEPNIDQALKFLGKKEVLDAIGFDLSCYFYVKVDKKEDPVEPKEDDPHKDL